MSSREPDALSREDRQLGCRPERTNLGLEIRLSLFPTGPGCGTDDASVLRDDMFECSSSDLQELTEYIQKNRPDLVRRASSKVGVTLLAPHRDPPVIRVTERSPRSGYFNLGELWRWRFLRKFREYPFKPHQSYGAKWLQGRRAAILADDMGLGKTLQAIAAIEEMKTAARIANALVVCPKSLIGVWEAEISLWAPHLCTVALHSGVDSREWRVIQTQCHVAIANYDAIRGSRPVSGAFDLVVFDEIHKLKNPKSLNYSAAYQLQPRYAWGLSGTPLENHTGDLTAILHLLDRKRIAVSDRSLAASSLRSLAARYVLRRARAVIAAELPGVIERTELVPLLPEQRCAYEDARRSWRSAKTIGAWLSVFNKLRNICDFDPQTRKSAKVDRATAIVSAVRKLGEKTVVFSWRIEPLRLIYREVTRSVGAGAVWMITGETESETRTNIVSAFQKSAVPAVLLCSIRATSEGLTLTAANHVVFVNEWWNPAVNAQARDRVNRIGQEKSVFVYRLRSQDTVESRMDELLSTKAALFHEIISRLTEGGLGSDERVPRELQTLVD